MEHFPKTDLARIRLLASRFRAAIENASPISGMSTLDDFPHGSCGEASLLLAKYLAANGFSDFDYVLGKRNTKFHAWLVRGDLIVDITADQFNDNSDPVIVTYDPGWHDEFLHYEKHPADFGIYDPGAQSSLSAAYDQIIPELR